MDDASKVLATVTAAFGAAGRAQEAAERAQRQAAAAYPDTGAAVRQATARLDSLSRAYARRRPGW